MNVMLYKLAVRPFNVVATVAATVAAKVAARVAARIAASVLVGALATLLLSAPLRAQAEDDYTREFRKGYEALVAGRIDEGIVSMKRCLELRSDDSTPAYNLACAYSLKNEPDAGFEWLGRALDLGFAFAQSDSFTMLASSDKDLANLRADARFAAVLERCKAQYAKVDAYAATPVVYVPAALEKAELAPLLVVLHDHGDTKDGAFANGPWKKLADELGYVLLIPSGKTPTSFHPDVDPSKGMAWFMNTGEYENNFWKYEKPIEEAVKALRKERKLDPQRVHIVGVGLGAIPAFNVAVSSPGLYKGVVSYNGWPNLRMAGAKLANAQKLGLETTWLFPSKPHGGVAGMPEAEYKALLLRAETGFKSTALKGGVVRFESPAEAESNPKYVDAAAVKSALAGFGAAKPAPAGEPSKQ
jgi:predicted esterase